MPLLHIDIETYSEVDLPKTGVVRYAEHPSTEILMIAWAVDDGPVTLIDLTAGDDLAEFLSAWRDRSLTKVAWNTGFERTLFRYVMDLPTDPEEWLDPMVLAYSVSLPGKLARAGKVIGLDADHAKDREGGRLIAKFSKPRKPSKYKPWTRCDASTDPVDWEKFKHYCVQDVIAEREIWHRLAPYNMPTHEWALWHLDQKINDRGWPIDHDLVQAAIEVAGELKTRLTAEAREITGLANVNSVVQLRQWLADQGVETEDLQAATIAALLRRDDLAAPVRRVLEIRQQTSRTTVNKFEAIDRSVASDGTVKQTMQFAGAGRTWRWAGRTVQPHNMFRPSIKDLPTAIAAVKRRDPDLLGLLYNNPIEVLASCTRPALRAPDGRQFNVADFNAIENRGAGWICQAESILDIFRQNRDPYRAYGVHLLGKPYEDITKAERTLCKPPVLGCQYRLGGHGLLQYAQQYGVDLTREESFRAVRVYRDLYPEVVEFWDRIQAAVFRAVFTGETVECWPVVILPSRGMLRIELPSGRCLHYVRPSIQAKLVKWYDEEGAAHVTEIESFCYWGMNDQNQWSLISSHAGKLLENIDQAICRDLLGAALVNAEDAGLYTVGHVHDEIIAVGPEGDDSVLKTLIDCMEAVASLPWAAGFPVRAEGFSSVFYCKD